MQQNPNDASPLAAFCQTLQFMGDNRKMLEGLFPAHTEALEDIAMLMNERVVIGLRNVWVRRVAVPVVYAQRALDGALGTEQERAICALEILRQLLGRDARMHTLCDSWIRRTYWPTLEVAS